MNGEPRVEHLPGPAAGAPGPGDTAPDTLEVRIALDRGDPIHGWIEPAGAPPVRFHGWMDLIAAINRFRAATDR